MSLYRHAQAFMQTAFARFLVGGASTTAVSYAVYLLMLLAVSYLIAYAISFALGVIWSYFVGTLFVFRRRPSVNRALAFPIVYVVQYLVGSLLMYALVDHLLIPAQFAPLIVVILTLPLTFVLSRWIITAQPGAKK